MQNDAKVHMNILCEYSMKNPGVNEQLCMAVFDLSKNGMHDVRISLIFLPNTGVQYSICLKTKWQIMIYNISNVNVITGSQSHAVTFGQLAGKITTSPLCIP